MAIGKQLSDLNPTGTGLGQSAADLITFYGGTPASQRASSTQATSNVAVSASFGATQLAALQEVMNVLIAVGLMKGSA
jgi:hypothetical protein